jgi:hypothetical protein
LQIYLGIEDFQDFADPLPFSSMSSRSPLARQLPSIVCSHRRGRAEQLAARGTAVKGCREFAAETDDIYGKAFCSRAQFL